MTKKLQHPDSTSRPIEVDDEAVMYYVAEGWVEVGPKKADAK